MDNKFCVGTKIVFKDEIGGGKITSVINHSKVLILRDDGFEEVYSIDSIFVLSDETYSETAFKFIPDLSKEEKVKKKISKKHKKKNKLVWEVDLHIEELVERHNLLSNYEIVQIQLRHCENMIRKAIQHKVHTLVIIHGKGEGVLKEEVRILLRKYNVEVNDGNYSKYGLGATEVHFF